MSWRGELTEKSWGDDFQTTNDPVGHPELDDFDPADFESGGGGWSGNLSEKNSHIGALAEKDSWIGTIMEK